MDNENILNALVYFDKFRGKIESGEVKWWAVSMKFNDGGTVAIHSKEAPKRPKGLS